MTKYYKPIIGNRAAFHHYNITETWKAGLVLSGAEVKSIRLGRVNFKDSFVRVDKSELWLYNMHVGAYSAGSLFTAHCLQPDRKRKLLLKKGEIFKIASRINEKGMTAVPLKLFIEGDWIKVEIGLGKAKKLFEKRETLKKRESVREVENALKRKTR